MRVAVVDCDGRILQIADLTMDAQSNYCAQEGATIIGFAPKSMEYFWDGSAFIATGEAPSRSHYFDYSLKEWVDPRTLDDLKNQKWAEIKSQRNLLEFGGFSFNGGEYDSDQTSQGRIALAASSSCDLVWTLADNTTRLLSATQLGQLYVSLQAHISQAHERGRIAREKLFTATTVEQIDSVVF